MNRIHKLLIIADTLVFVMLSLDWNLNQSLIEMRREFLFLVITFIVFLLEEFVYTKRCSAFIYLLYVLTYYTFLQTIRKLDDTNIILALKDIALLFQGIFLITIIMIGKSIQKIKR